MTQEQEEREAALIAKKEAHVVEGTEELTPEEKVELSELQALK